MTTRQLEAYDRFLDENDWDIYYWATQEPSPTSRETAEGAGPDAATPAAQGHAGGDVQWRPDSGEWAQTVGRSKPAYRPVPQRWAQSDILTLLRRHVASRRVSGGGSGLGQMPLVQTFSQ